MKYVLDASVAVKWVLPEVDSDKAILSTAPTLHSYLPLLPRAVELSSQMKIGVYDCLYFALAEQEQCELVTADLRLVNIFGGQVVSLASV